jgi:hypothetical protein
MMYTVAQNVRFKRLKYLNIFEQRHLLRIHCCPQLLSHTRIKTAHAAAIAGGFLCGFITTAGGGSDL